MDDIVLSRSASSAGRGNLAWCASQSLELHRTRPAYYAAKILPVEALRTA